MIVTYAKLYSMLLSEYERELSAFSRNYVADATIFTYNVAMTFQDTSNFVKILFTFLVRANYRLRSFFL
jgi:hypothetical protein